MKIASILLVSFAMTHALSTHEKSLLGNLLEKIDTDTEVDEYGERGMEMVDTNYEVGDNEERELELMDTNYEVGDNEERGLEMMDTNYEVEDDEERGVGRMSPLRKVVVQIKKLVESLIDKVDGIAAKTDVPDAYRTEYKVYHFQSPLGPKKYTHNGAIARCHKEGMIIAKPEQLQVAWKNGMDVCSCGWLSDGTIRYPVQYPRYGCGFSSSGVIKCGLSKTSDVYCYKQ